ncbi:carbon-nitrogen hydrolase family protein [Oceanicella sp. SM1341]|uniref:carbon-nitrogen hydrolase family protein n=1 Tax=Oceanicella sp. SM1341 TaxID=1548889 RepID=UPI000E503BE1|nr:carbon-nitrogen hydrolase family protein [Oceanicella sp. SM1341]
MVRVSAVEWPDGLEAGSRDWAAIAGRVRHAAPDILVTNEMPFGNWLAGGVAFCEAAAERSIEAHRRGLGAMADLGVPAVLTSRPVREGARLANEAVCLVDGQILPLHRKQMFPAEPGWHETAWFHTASTDFSVREIAGLRSGMLLCTELMFSERARTYGLDGAALIAAPRATGSDLAPWHIAGAMAALGAAAYVVSSNRVGGSAPVFGGRGFIIDPTGRRIATTSPRRPLVTADIDPVQVAAGQQAAYPLYVARAARGEREAGPGG